MRDKISTTHSDLRLIQRAREFDKPMTEVWEQAVPCEVKYHGYDEARVSAEYDIVLLKEDSKIVTCLNNTHNVTVAGQDFESFLNDAVRKGSKSHSTNKHRASDDFSMSSDEAAEMEANPNCHCGLAELARRGDVSGTPSPSRANDMAPVPDEMARHLDSSL